MKTPERSVEEIVEEFKHLKVPENREDIKNWKKMDNWLTQTLQAERQKREELIKYDLYGEARALDIPMETVKKLQEALTQPNNK